ncbi:uncharacterized protein BDZ99DRAFT_460686 [Mytilinidion resinicola]|uniref:Uncharacterized protein n=1 Tax=Mytilinidion resinicola TaxID=574789 RepID=A0A6A6YWY9_9PEZI|nr:uncharacterized protein BDZ99DRAFT_460686 [Mytilinidion resinicola]KAF2813446.1 hypothetical protein BDZ99DRAFT_460686 [Mytilinidion resinicola]
MGGKLAAADLKYEETSILSTNSDFLQDAEIAYKDIRYSFEEYPKYKATKISSSTQRRISRSLS